MTEIFKKILEHMVLHNYVDLNFFIIFQYHQIKKKRHDRNQTQKPRRDRAVKKITNLTVNKKKYQKTFYFLKLLRITQNQ